MVQGIDKAMASELLEFPNEVYGMVLNLEEDHIGAVLLGSDSLIKEGDEVRRTGRIVEVTVGDSGCVPTSHIASVGVTVMVDILCALVDGITKK